MEFEDQLHALIYFHLEEHTSGRHLLQVLKEDDFARQVVAPKPALIKAAFSITDLFFIEYVNVLLSMLLRLLNSVEPDKR